MNSARDASFIFVTGMVRALENRLLSRGAIESMFRAETGDEIFYFLKGTIYSAYAETVRSPSMCDRMIHEARSELYRFIDKYSGDPGIGHFFRLDYDYHNIKYLLKKNIFREPGVRGLSPFGNIDPDLMERIFEREEYGSLPGIMRDAVYAAIEGYYSVKKGFIIDFVSDSYLLKDLLERAVSSGGKIIENYFRRRIDAVNIMSLLRGNEAIMKYSDYLFIEGGIIETDLLKKAMDDPRRGLAEIAARKDLDGIGSALDEKVYLKYAVERECRKLMMMELYMARFMISGIEPLFAYACRVESDLKTIGMIFASKNPAMKRGAAEASVPDGGVW